MVIDDSTKNFLNKLPSFKRINVIYPTYAALFPIILEEPLSYTVLKSMLAGTMTIASRTGL
jgi:hypothetical protein